MSESPTLNGKQSYLGKGRFCTVLKIRTKLCCNTL